jgi:xylulokinase
MPGPFLIGIDLGSSFTKASIFDASGKACGQASSDNHPAQPRPGVAEYDGEHLLEAILRATREVLHQSSVAARDIAALSVCGMISGIIGVDAAGNPTTPYSNTLDMRFAPQLNYVIDHFHDAIRQRTGSGQPTLAPKMLWFREALPAAYAATAKFVTASGYVLGKLAGLRGDEFFIDDTHLWATGLADSQNYRWSTELCQAMDLPVEKLPRIVRASDVIGRVTHEIARATGLIEGTPIVAGCGDQSAGFIGAGITRPGRTGDVAGTYPVIAFCTDQFRPDLERKLTEIIPSAIPGLYNPISFIIGGGLTHHWFQEQFAGPDAAEAERRSLSVYAVLDGKAEQVAPGSDKVFFIPHMGGRACPNNTAYRGAWFGFTWAHRREHFYRAVLESIAYDQYLALQSLQAAYPECTVSDIRVYGGGARSGLWNQIKADVMGMPYVRLDRDDLAALGTAILAGYAVGIYDDMAAVAERFAGAREHFEPRPAVHAFYRQYAEFYGRLLTQAEPAYAAMADLPEWQP